MRRLLLALVVLAGLAALWRWVRPASEAPEGALPTPEHESPDAAEGSAGGRASDGTTAREPAPVSEVGAGAEAGAAPVLELRFVSAVDGSPIPDVGFVCEADAEPGEEEPRWQGSANAEGVAILDVIEGRAIAVTVWETEERGRAEVEVGPLALGERAVRTIELPVGRDREWYVRVESKGEPVAGARAIAIELDERNRRSPVEEAATDATGLAHFRCRSWVERDVRIEAPGKGVALVAVSGGHETPAEALVVSLWPSGTLRALVTDGAGEPLEGVRVEAGVPGHLLVPPDAEDAITWITFDIEGTTDAQGVALLQDLPAGLNLEVTLSREGRVLHREERAPPLAAGETNERRYVLTSGGSIVARVLDPEGVPVAGVRLWVVRPPEGETGERQLHDRDWPRARGQAATDADGRAAFTDLPLGLWNVGPVPPDGPNVPIEGIEASPHVAKLARAALAPMVELTADAPAAEITLQLAPGLAIAGRFVDEEGAPIHGAGASAYGRDFAFTRFVRSAEDGTFRIEDLPAGPYGLEIYRGDGPWIEPPDLEVAAGTEDLVIALRRGGSIRGSLRDAATGAIVLDAEVVAFATEIDRPHARRAAEFVYEETFELRGLEDGAHALLAKSFDGRIGVLTGLQVRRREATEADVRLAPGVPVRVHYGGEAERCDVLVTWQGVAVSYVAYRPGSTESFLAPAGPLEILVEPEGAQPRRFARVAELGSVLEIRVE